MLRLRNSLALFGALSALAATSLAADRRAFVGGSYAVFLDGKVVAHTPNVSGGAVSAPVVVDKAGATGAYPKKHLGSPVYDDIIMELSPGVDPALSSWARESIKGAQPLRKDGSVAAVDAVGKELSRTNWTQGFVSDLTLLGLSADSRDPVRIQLTVTPQSTQSQKPTGANVDLAAIKAKGKQVLGSSFRLAIDGVDLKNVTKVEPVGVRLRSISSGVGEMRDYEKTPGQVDVSNLTFVVPLIRADSILKWHEDFVVKGKNDDKAEKSGSLQVLDQAGRTVVLELRFKGIGISKVSPDTSSTEVTRNLRVECYVESIELVKM